VPAFLKELNPENILPQIRENMDDDRFWVQIGAILLAVLLSWWAGARIKRKLANDPTILESLSSRIYAYKRIYPFRIVLLPALWIAALAVESMGAPCGILKITTLLVTAFMLLNLPTKFMKNRFWVRFVAMTAFLVASLYLFGVLDDVTEFLESQHIPLIPWDISLFQIVSGIFTLVLLLWLAGFLSRFSSSRLEKLTDMPPSARVLLGKAIHFGAFTLALILSYEAFGGSLTGLTVFGGALGLGLGFGLQKVVSNLFSGLIILLDKSIKPGDVIEIGDTYGWINSLRTRYVSVITRDNKEHLIPNEDLITQPVINWSFTDRLVRLRTPIGVSYDSDLRQVIDLCVAAASSFERVLEDPAPSCLLRGFGDSSVDFELRFWIQDPASGTANITSDVLLAVWDAFKENAIEIPFPQRDIHVRSSSQLPGPPPQE